MTFGQEVKRSLAEQHVSLRALSRRINYDPGYVSKVLNGKSPVTPEIATAIDKALGAHGSLAALAETLTHEEHDRVSSVIEQPARLDSATVTALGEVLAAQRRADDHLPARIMLPSVRSQWSTLRKLAQDARGPHAEAAARVAAEWCQFLGWLHAESGTHKQAVRLLTEAEEWADQLEDGPLAAQAANFRGYVARHRGNPRGIVRWFTTAYHTPGAAPLQRVGDAVQAAHGWALLGDHHQGRRLLGEATDLLGSAADTAPPATAYWLSPTFSHLNIGLALLGLGDHDQAAEHLRYGLTNLPEDQAGAEWTHEYREALALAVVGEPR